jgi:hypothetical protein
VLAPFGQKPTNLGTHFQVLGRSTETTMWRAPIEPEGGELQNCGSHRPERPEQFDFGGGRQPLWREIR